MYNWWKSGNPDMIIRMADDKDMKFLFKHGLNRIPIGPTERAVFIKDGKMLGLIDQDTIKIADEWTEERIGRIKKFFRKLAGMKKEPEYEQWDYHQSIKKRVMDGHINVLLVDATTIDISVPISSTHEVFTADARENITGKLILRFSFDLLQTPKQMNLLTKSKAMTVPALSQRIQDEIFSEVVKPVISQYNSDEIYGNREIREMSEMAVTHEMEKTFDTWGMNVEKVILNLDTPERIKRDHELNKIKDKLDHEKELEQLEWKKEKEERLHKWEREEEEYLHRKKIEDQEWRDGIEKEEREREYERHVQLEKEKWEKKRKEEVREEKLRIEADRRELEEQQHELELKKKRDEIDLMAYMNKVESLQEKEDQLQRLEYRRRQAEDEQKEEWEFHKRRMDAKEQDLRRTMAEKQQAHVQEMEKKHDEHVSEMEKKHAEHKAKLEQEIHKMKHDEEMREKERREREKVADTEATMYKDKMQMKMELIKQGFSADQIKAMLEDEKILEQEKAKKQAAQLGGEETRSKLAEAEAEKYKLDTFRKGEDREREFAEKQSDRQWGAISESMRSMQAVQQTQAVGLGQNIAPQATTQAQNAATSVTRSGPPPLPGSVEWYAGIDNQKKGPFNMDALQEQIKNGTISRDTLLWKEGMSQWSKAEEISELSNLFRSVPPPLPF